MFADGRTPIFSDADHLALQCDVNLYLGVGMRFGINLNVKSSNIVQLYEGDSWSPHSG